MASIGAILSDDDLAALRETYGKLDGRTSLEQGMQKTLPQIYKPAEEYIGAIMKALYGELPPDNAPPPRDSLSRRDRERCLIALLASRGEDMTLAIHIYFGMMEELAPNEIAHILLLAGIYSGVDNFTKGLFTAIKLLTALAAWTSESTQKGDPNILRAEQILERIKKLFA